MRHDHPKNLASISGSCKVSQDAVAARMRPADIAIQKFLGRVLPARHGRESPNGTIGIGGGRNAGTTIARKPQRSRMPWFTFFTFRGERPGYLQRFLTAVFALIRYVK